MPGKHKAICMQNICVQLLHEDGIRLRYSGGEQRCYFSIDSMHKRIMYSFATYKVTLFKPDQLEGLGNFGITLDGIA